MDNSVPLSIERQISNPYSINTPKEFLCRMYEVGSYTWTGAPFSQTIPFPGALYAIATIANSMKRFALFRGTIHVEVKMNSTPYHQGTLISSWVPCAYGTLLPDAYFLSGTDPAVVLSASLQDSCSFDIPYLHPLDWLSWSSSGTTDSSICNLYIQSISQLVSSSSSISASVSVTVFAGFKDIEVTGYVAQAGRGSKFDTNNEAHAKAKAGVDVKAIAKTASTIAKTIPVVSDVWSPIAGIINSAFGTDLSKPVSQEAQQYVTQLYMPDNAQVAGLTNAYQLTLYPNPSVSNAPKMYGMDTSHVSVSQLAQRPMLWYTQTLTTGAPTLTIAGAANPLLTDPTFGGLDWLAKVTYAHKFFRGGVKYLVHFVLPAFYSFRVQFMLFYSATVVNTGDITSRIVDIKGDSWEEITVPYLYPTTWMNVDSSMTLLNPSLKITIITAIVGSSAPAAAVVPVEIYRAGAEDVEFSGMRNASPTFFESRKVQAQCALGSRFSKPFQALNSGTTLSVERGHVMSEITGTVSDLLKRTSQAGSPTSSFPGTTVSAPTAFEPFYYWFDCFLFWRGGRIMRNVHPGTTFGGTSVMDGVFLSTQLHASHNTFGTGWAPLYPAKQSVISPETYHIPYFCPQPYYPNYASTANFLHQSCYTEVPIDFVAQVTPRDFYTYSGADDFVYLCPYPFFRITGVLNRTSPEVRNSLRAKSQFVTAT